MAQLRAIVLNMRADKDDGDDAPPYEIGSCDMFEGMRWSAASASFSAG